MSEYIKREDAESEAIFLARGDAVKKGGTIKPFKECFIKERIRQLPSIDIVKCRDCKWRGKAWCLSLIVDASDDDFCSFGERKEQKDE